MRGVTPRPAPPVGSNLEPGRVSEYLLGHGLVSWPGSGQPLPLFPQTLC